MIRTTERKRLNEEEIRHPKDVEGKMDRTVFDIANKSLQTTGEVLDRNDVEINFLRAELAEARGQLCRAREAFIEIVNNCGCADDADFCMNCVRANEAIAALSSTSPCPHETEAKWLREVAEYADRFQDGIQLGLLAMLRYALGRAKQKNINMEMLTVEQSDSDLRRMVKDARRRSGAEGKEEDVD
jgi:hypothetical protein